MKIPEPWGKAEVLTLGNRDQGGPHNKGKKDSYTLTESPFPHTGTAPYGQGPPVSMVSSMRKRKPKVHIQLPQHCRTLPGRPTQISPHKDHWGICRAKKGDEAYSKQHSDLSGLHSCSQQHSSRDSRQRLYLSAEPMQWPHLARSSVGSSA